MFLEKSSRNGSEPPSNIDQLVAFRSESPSAEAYRLVRTAIQWYSGQDDSMRDFAVLSAGPGEGKTTVSSNIAIALAQIGLNVLLVDADIRRGRLHTSYDLVNDKGLGHYLTDNLPIDDVIQKSSVPGLSVVTRGASIINPSQLFSSRIMADFVRETRARFDMVIYDTPPLMIISDTSILLSQLDGALMVACGGVTKSRMLPKAISMVMKTKAKLIGVALNSAHFSENPYYNKYYQRT